METLFEILKSIILGIVQGITEWLPISSTAHLKLVQQFMPLFPSDAIRDSFSSMYDVVIQLGSILAVLVLFFHKLNPFSPRKTEEQKRSTLSLWGKVLIASIPAAVVGLIIDHWLDDFEVYHRTAYICVIAIALILYGVAFILMENARRKPRIQTFDQMPPKVAFGIGVFQMLALIPGTSRSGSTILGSTMLGTSRPIAAEFSFFMAIPVMLGASGLKMVKAAMKGTLAQFTFAHWLSLITGFVVAFIVSLFVIRALMWFIKKHSFKPFGVYRIAIGVVILLLACFGVFSGAAA